MVRLEKSIGLEVKRPLSQSKVMRKTGIRIQAGTLQAVTMVFQRSNLERSGKPFIIFNPLLFQVIRPAGSRPVISVPSLSRRRLNTVPPQYLGG